MAFVPGLRERKKLATQQALGCAAIGLAMERGLENVLVEDIAAAADVSPRTFNNYFASKTEAICSIAVDQARRIAETLRERPVTEPLWSAIIHAVLREFDDSAIPNDTWRAGVRLITNHPALQGEYRRAQGLIQEALAAAIAERTGRAAAADMYPRVAAGAVAAALDVAATRWIESESSTAILPFVREALRQLTLMHWEFPMDVPTSHTLAVPGATLYYEIRGSGPLLLLVPGGNGDAGTFGPVAALLADRYTVVSYDRRGFSRSPCEGEPQRRVDLDAEDAARLLTHLAAEPAAVLGSSSGAIVALELLIRYPERIRTLVAHEPPLAGLLPDSARWFALFDDVRETGRREGELVAMAKFAAGVGLQGPPPAAGPSDQSARIQRNLRLWMDQELDRFPRHDLDVEALRPEVGKLVLAVGADSGDAFAARPNAVLAQRLGLRLTEFPGHHIGYLTHPADFADQVVKTLRS
ncbi:alpha/beta fold hydrolase [Nocardia mexicana]|uniref:TetR family transcriptional regulator n=1 Tax=Nocardia mexicana TaxID=279262 RepID=A0A370H348_9NOCA|nr:alpha/beta fold hydrolase [Nocardia mexicana]RDI50074.1 TetR family transcriptional regulator [Nocardia mexicana]